MGHSRTLHSPDDIVAAGAALERDNPGKAVTAWEIHKKLGNRGNYPRTEKIWEQHLASRPSAPAHGQLHDELAEQLVTGIATALDTAMTTILSSVSQDSKRRAELFVSRMQILDNQHVDENARQKEEIADWRGEVIRLAAQVEELMQELDQERALRRAAEEAAAARTVTWRLPVVGENVPLVSPTRVAPLYSPARPEPIASRYRRGHSRSEARQPEAADDDAAAAQEPEILSVPPADPEQIELPI